jgi:hypothetical protein
MDVTREHFPGYYKIPNSAGFEFGTFTVRTADLKYVGFLNSESTEEYNVFMSYENPANDFTENYYYFDLLGNLINGYGTVEFPITQKSMKKFFKMWKDHEESLTPRNTERINTLRDILERIQILVEKKRLAVIHIMQEGQDQAAARQKPPRSSYLASDHNPFARKVLQYAGLYGGRKTSKKRK